jgi:hypothetical protein
MAFADGGGVINVFNKLMRLVDCRPVQKLSVSFWAGFSAIPRTPCLTPASVEMMRMC